MGSFLRWLRRWLTPSLTYRLEDFGGIVMSEDPPLLVTLDRAGMRKMIGERAQWSTPEVAGPSSSERAVDAHPRYRAPVEAHVALTNACTAGCDHCYMDSAEPLPDEIGLSGAREVMRELASMGVFHVALGGGESMLLPWVFEAAEYARSLGMVPNITTSGIGMTEEKAKRCRVFGRINVSLDGVSAQSYASLRGRQHFEQAVRAIELLRDHNDSVGINCVVTRKNFDTLGEITAFAAARELDEVEFLRLKPAGRGTALYLALRLSREQGLALLPRLLELRRRDRIAIKLDCSFAPFVAAHDPTPEQLELFSVLGCEGGDYLIGVDAQGNAHPCSFEHDVATDARTLSARWNAVFPQYRGYRAQAAEPCRSCAYASICRGGCRIVATFLADSAQPDPECPRVRL